MFVPKKSNPQPQPQPNPQPIPQANPNENVYDILQRLELKELWPQFQEQDITSINVLSKLSEEDMKELGISVGSRRLLQDEIDKLNSNPSQNNSQLEHKPPTTDKKIERNRDDSCCCISSVNITEQYDCKQRKLFWTKNSMKWCVAQEPEEYEYSFDDLYIDMRIIPNMRLNDRICGSAVVTTTDGKTFAISGGFCPAARAKEQGEEFSQLTGIPIRTNITAEDIALNSNKW
eukprot:gb/GECH01001889.1/.p1 GENE.gb/GECH01001889.1/~~gb/GECH01001889.1/.p1  ORF type:complete len:232 (+),score=51.87 gb/GECH01001889.1/:1-696(+)